MEGEIFLKKKWILLTAALLLALGGCQGKDETVVQNEEAFREYEVNLSDKLSDFQFAMNEEVYTPSGKHGSLEGTGMGNPL